MAFTSLPELSALPRLLNVVGTIKLVKLAVLAKAPWLIVVKAVVDRSRAVMPELKKALVPIEVIRVGNFTSVKLAVFWKTALSIAVIAV